MENKTVIIGLSGGVDSAYAAHLLKQRGYEVIGVNLRMFGEAPNISAENTAKELGIQFVSVDARKAFEKYVTRPFIDSYLKGLTPNPCVECNRYVKIKLLEDVANEYGADHFATGHYAFVENTGEDGRYAIVCGRDADKDQSYFLWRLTQKQLSMFLTPLASLTKAEITKRAAEVGLSSAENKQSLEICFIPDNDYRAYLAANTELPPHGNFIDTKGNIIGTHNGIVNYTVGQRKHLGIVLGYPAYVIGKDAADNTVTVGGEAELMSSGFVASDLNFQSINAFSGTREFKVKTRYAKGLTDAVVTVENGVATARFASKQRAAAPGQSAVFYENGAIAFGGIIDRTLKE